MNVDNLTTVLAFERADRFVGCAPMGVWAVEQQPNTETPEGPRWRATLAEPLASVSTRSELLRQLYLNTGPGTYYVLALSGEGAFWAKVPDALVEDILHVFDVEE